MKALLCHRWGTPDDLTLEDVAAPPLLAHEVRVAVRACSINFADVLIIAGKYQAKPPFPFTPGAEVSGTVLACGADVTHLPVGTRVLSFCGMGGLAEEVVTAATNVLPIPDELDFAAAAGFLVAYGTAHVALRHRAGLLAGETLLVHGAGGGVGLAAVDIGRHLGATVIATASTPEKLQAAADRGATHGINYATDDFVARVKELTGGQGVDVVFDPVGGDVFDQSLKCLRTDGRVLVIGFANGRIPQVATNALLLKNATLMGVFWGAYAQKNPRVLLESAHELLDWQRRGHIRPLVSQTFPLERAAEAFYALERRQVIGKVVVTMGAG